jgi:hypothetical protein
MSASNCNETILTPALPLENAGWRMLQRVAPALADGDGSVRNAVCVAVPCRDAAADDKA